MRSVVHYALRITVAIAALSSIPNVHADNGGISGRSINGCGNCHGANATAALNITVNGNRTVKTGQIVDMNVVIAQGALQAAGLNLAIKNGDGQNVGVITPGAGGVMLDGEMTHAGAVPMNQQTGSATFPFTWGTPALHGVYQLTVAGIAVNDNDAADPGDQWRALAAINLTVQGATITSPNAGATYCPGSSVVINWTQTGYTQFRIDVSSNNGTTWEAITNAVNAANNTYTWVIPAGQTASTGYKVRLLNAANNEVVTISDAFAISSGPTITLQPEDVSVCVNGSFTLSVGVEGVNNQYRWRKGGVWIPGATTSTYSDFDVTFDDAGTYDVQIFGCGETISRTVTVKVLERPSITTQPTDQFVCEGQAAVISLMASGDSLRYQWYKNGEAMPGKIAPTLSWDAASLFDDASYYCIINAVCTPERISDTVRLSIVEPPKLTGWSSSQNLQEGDTLSLSVQAVGKNLQFTWKKDGVIIPGATASTFSIKGVVRADSGLYACVVRNACDSATTTTIEVKVRPGSGPGVLTLATTVVDIGSLAVCARKDTTIAALLRNRGGAPVTLNSISVDAASLVMPVDLSTPLVIPAGGSRDVLLRITPRTEGELRATISFFTQAGRLELSVVGEIISALQFVRDTVTFIPDIAEQAPRCNYLQYIACDTVVITSVRVTGSGASTYRVQYPVQLPVTLVRGQGFEVCLEAIGGTGGAATVQLESNAGKDNFLVMRDISAGIDASSPSVSAYVSPNPSMGDVEIRLPAGTHAVRIVNAAGATINTFDVQSDRLLWDGTGHDGQTVAAGMYLLVIDGPQGRQTLPLAVIR